MWSRDSGLRTEVEVRSDVPLSIVSRLANDRFFENGYVWNGKLWIET